MSRLSPTKETVRAVAIRSKNKCAFPGCDHLLMNEEGTFIAELCHIEAAEPGGQRYNSAQSPEDRRSASNLFFMCHAHHKETDDEIKYTVSRLREIKSTHEAMPEVIYNQELLLQAIEKVSLE